MKISTRLSLAGIFSVGVVAVIGFVLLSATHQVRQELTKNETAGEILNAATAVRYLTLEYVASHEDRVRAQWELRHASLSKLLAGATEFTGQEEQSIIEDLRHTHQGVNTLFTELAANQQNREAEKGKGAILKDLESRLTGQIMNKAQAMISGALSLSDRSRTGVLDAQQRTSAAVVTFGGVVVFVIAATLFLALGSVTRPLEKLREGIAIVGAGNLDHRLAITAKDEIGSLSRAFDEMTEKLKATTVSRDELGQGNAVLQAEVAERKRVEENLRLLMQETQEIVNVLSSFSSEIVASTTQLAASASQSAAAVTETTTTVEEVRQTAQVASQKARLVSDSAQKAAQSSQNGRKSTEDVGAGMTRIRQQMEAIAASMTRLSEQSRAIGRIMASVEDLAAQSNLLAVNAAIEAARAGEHGKGFGVVAQEVKSLAEQSRQATTQVRTILGDIQKATIAAVLATEQGSKAVEAGSRQTEVAGESIQALAGSVTEAVQAATQIAASSQQQLAGVDQVAGAMESIRQASTQNVASARQLEVAARNLDELGQRLKQMAERYKV
ncbi:methyl-accepting chemotaxis protein [Polaromonas sp. JS666]|uniref:methyl-accepting chemotaxis protein n=1 Tax=Polaromonas sp. (strain JS666 / ATCC BAA-500) TaxID=296591 RepID=UPI0000534F11|nr:HAMP domain-containing methyl-accepting chemotaxis protein [Polaromonas sp. JS666]ABE44384.1 methyl-accepting chemotaxis sensory transducer [Polaromonas sp. JS666]UUZ73926.1 methyl-accepting chemotaxis protein [Polaromonas sp. P1(28)-8]